MTNGSPPRRTCESRRHVDSLTLDLSRPQLVGGNVLGAQKDDRRRSVADETVAMGARFCKVPSLRKRRRSSGAVRRSSLCEKPAL